MQTEPQLEVVYNAAMECEQVKAQQRPAPASQPREQRAVTHEHRARVARFLRQFPTAWTVAEISRLTAIPNYAAYNAVRFCIRDGVVMAVQPGRGHRGTSQRYQWSGV